MPDFTPLGRPLPFRLILASGSRGRRELLELHRYTFDVIPSHIDEPTDARLGDCAHYVAELAWLKAQAVAKTQTSGVVLAADTVGWINNHVVGKPDDEAHARRILTELAGTTHELYTGVCLWHVPTGRQLSWQERSLVRMKALTPRNWTPT
jgi:septum formation protein